MEKHFSFLPVSSTSDLLDARSRALDNIGRAYSVLGEYQKAADQ